jgi:hypothetical protein
MSFIDTAAELLERTEASLGSLMADALKAKAYREVATIAAMAESVAVIGPGRSREGRRTSGAEVGVGAQVGTDKASEPSWMRP